MFNLRSSRSEKGEAKEMFFSRSISFDDEDPADVAAATTFSLAYTNAESQFIDKLKAGDSEAFDVLITRYSSDVYALLYQLTENPEEAADLAQETFMSALTSIKGFRGDAVIKTWLFRIAINHSRNRFRWWKRRKREMTVSLDASIGSSETKVHETIADKGENPEESAMIRERQSALKIALFGLPEIFREVIVLCDIEGMSYEEISQSLGLNIGTVKSRIARGREELRRKLKDF